MLWSFPKICTNHVKPTQICDQNKEVCPFKRQLWRILYGQSEVRYAVIDLLIDHGIPSRGHRENILNPKYKYFSVYEIPYKVGKMEYFFIQQFDY